MATKLLPDEYKQLHQRVCKIFYSQMASQAPAEDATKLLTKIDEATKTKEEFLEVLEKKLHRIQDPVAWIKEKKEPLEQVSRKLEMRKAVDPTFENRLSEIGRQGMQLIHKVVKNDLATLTITTDDLNKMQQCMQEIKLLFKESSSHLPPAPQAGTTQQHTMPNRVIPPAVNGNRMPPQQMQPQAQPQMYQQTVPSAPMPQQQKFPPSSAPVPPPVPRASEPPRGPPSSSIPNQVGSKPPAEPSFEDGIFGIIVIELQYLLKKCFERPTKLTVATLTGKFEALLSLLTGWSSKNQKYFDESYSARINNIVQLITLIMEPLTQTLSNDDNNSSSSNSNNNNSASIEIIYQYPAILKSFQLYQLMIDEMVTFETKRLQEKNYDPEGFLKKRKLDPDFQRRINDLFRKSSQSLKSGSSEQRVDFSQAYEHYNGTVSGLVSQQFPGGYGSQLYGGISNY